MGMKRKPLSIMKKLWEIIYIILQCTWGVPQTLLGFILFLKYYKCPHKIYHGCIRTKWERYDGISLGLFIFTPNENAPKLIGSKNRERFKEYCEKVAVHEYGHTYQSLIFGPLYLVVIGIVSLSWAKMNRYKTLRKEYGVPYSFCWTEQWANALGEKILKQPSIR